MHRLPALLAGAALLGATALPAASARRPDYEPRAKRCERLAGKLERHETKQLERCGVAEGCSAGKLRRHQRIAEKFATNCVRLNEIQALGSHNSYHVQPKPALWAALLAAGGTAFLPWEYSHLPLDQQFETQGVRQIELDVFADPLGGLYRTRLALALAGGDPEIGPPILDEPGMKVFHVQDIDFETTCLTLVQCMQTVRFWSDTRPSHLPIAILLELKDDVLPGGLTVPVPWTPALMDDLDAEIRSVFPPAQLITPDDVRGDFETLEEAVLSRGWPTLGWARGKVIFLMDNGGGSRNDYLQGHPSLAGRVLFTNSQPGSDDAAFVKMNNPFTTSPSIPTVVGGGYVVRTRADADLEEGRANDTGPRDQAIGTAAHWVSSDFPEPRPELGSDYFVQIPGGSPARCNPITAPAACRSFALESLP